MTTQAQNQALYKRVMLAFRESHGYTRHSEIADTLKVTRQLLTDWKQGESSPQRHLKEIARLTGKTIDWFHSDDNVEESEKILPITRLSHLSEEDARMHALLQRLPPSTKADAMAIIETLARRHINDLDFDDEKIYTLDDLLEMLEGMRKKAASPAKAKTIAQVMEGTAFLLF